MVGRQLGGQGVVTRRLMTAAPDIDRSWRTDDWYDLMILRAPALLTPRAYQFAFRAAGTIAIRRSVCEVRSLG